MKLTKISAINLKGRTFSFTLSPATVFHGRNFKGKTSVMDAIRLALLGYLPELGKNNRDTFGLASGTELVVNAEFDNGLAIRRRWSLKGNSVTAEHEVPDAIKDMGQLLVMLNASEYFGLGNAARVNYVFAHCPAGAGFSAQQILQRIDVKVRAAHDAKAVDAFHGQMSAKQDGKTYPSTQLFVEDQLEVVREFYKTAKAVAKRAEATIQQLTDMRLRDEPMTPVATLEVRRKDLTVRLAELNEQKGAVSGRFQQMKNDRQRRESIDRELIGNARARITLAELRGDLVAIDAKLVANPEVASTQLATAWRKIGEVNAQRTELLRQQAAAEQAHQAAQKRFSGLYEETTCPYCGATGDGWKAIKEAELVTEMDSAKGIAAALVSGIAVFDKSLKDATAEHELLAAGQKRHNQLALDRSALMTRIQSLELSLAREPALKDELARLATDDPAITTEVETVQTELNVKNQDVRLLDVEITKANGRVFELSRLANAEKERDGALVEAAIAEMAGKELVAIQTEMVAMAFKPLLARANEFFGHILPDPLAYNEKEGGEIGMWRGGLWIGHLTMSGTEKALVYAAIQAALTMASPLRLMLIDELGRFDYLTVDRFINAVCRAVDQDRIDGFVGIDVGRPEAYQIHAEANSALSVIEIA